MPLRALAPILFATVSCSEGKATYARVDTVYVSRVDTLYVNNQPAAQAQYQEPQTTRTGYTTLENYNKVKQAYNNDLCLEKPEVYAILGKSTSSGIQWRIDRGGYEDLVTILFNEQGCAFKISKQ
jgi:hypothetical protein